MCLFFSTKFESHNHLLLWGWLAINDKEVVCGRWNRFVKSPHSSVNSVLSRIGWLWKRYLSLCLHLKEWGKVCLRNKILSTYFVPISVHIVGDFLKVLVKIQIFMFVGDGNPAWLVEVKEQTLGKVRYPRLQNYQNQGLKCFHDTFPSTLSLVSLSRSAYSLRSAFSVSLEKLVKPVGSSLDQRNSIP